MPIGAVLLLARVVPAPVLVTVAPDWLTRVLAWLLLKVEAPWL